MRKNIFASNQYPIVYWSRVTHAASCVTHAAIKLRYEYKQDSHHQINQSTVIRRIIMKDICYEYKKCTSQNHPKYGDSMNRMISTIRGCIQMYTIPNGTGTMVPPSEFYIQYFVQKKFFWAKVLSTTVCLRAELVGKQDVWSTLWEKFFTHPVHTGEYRQP